MKDLGISTQTSSNENIGFKEAVEFLADRAKIPIPVTDNSNETLDELKIKEYHKECHKYREDVYHAKQNNGRIQL